MAISNQAVATSINAASVSVTLPSTPTNGNMLVLVYGGYRGGNTSLTVSPLTWTMQENNSAQANTAIWTATSDGSTKTFTVTNSSSSHDDAKTIWIAEIPNTTGVIDGAVSSSNSLSSNAAIAIAPGTSTHANELWIAAWNPIPTSGGAAVTAASFTNGFVEECAQGGVGTSYTTSLIVGALTTTSAGAFSTTITTTPATYSGGDWVSLGLVLSAPAGITGSGTISFNGTATAIVPIWEVGSLADTVYSSGGTTLAVNPANVGDLLVVTVDSHATFGLTSLSGGGVTTWQKAVQFISARSHDIELWFGQVTTAGSSTITFTWPSSNTLWTEYTAQEFTSNLGAGAQWGINNGQAQSVNGANSTNLPYPQLTPSANTIALYYGFAGMPNTPSAGTTPSFTYVGTTGGNLICYDPGVTTTVSPTASQSPAGLSEIVGALFSIKPSQLLQTGIARISKSVTATQGGVARIQNNRTFSQTGAARIQLIIPKTQAGVARIIKTIGNIQPGIARIQTTRTISQIGTSRIQSTIPKVQTGIASISKTINHTQPGIARIQINHTVSQLGVGRIQNIRVATQAGTARIQNNGSIQTGISRIQKSLSIVQTGTSRLSKVDTKSQTGTASIVNSNTIVATSGGGNWSSTSTWVGGVVPTAGNDVQLNASSGNVTIDTSNAVCRSLNCTGYTGILTHNSHVNLTIGTTTTGASNIALLFVPGMTYTSADHTPLLILNSTSITQQTITTGGQTLFNCQMGDSSHKGNYIFEDAFTNYLDCTFTLDAGTLNTNNQVCSFGTLNLDGLGTSVLTLGSSTITITGPRMALTTFNTTVNANTSTIIFDNATYSNAEFLASGVTLNNVEVTSTLQFTVQAVVCSNFSYIPSSASIQSSLLVNQSLTISNSLTITGSLAPNRVLIQSSSLGASATITCNGTLTTSNADFMDIKGAGTASWNLSSITGGAGDCGGNSNITFTPAQSNYYMSSVNDNYSTASKWYLATNGGGGAGRVPLPQDTAIFDSNTGNHTYTLDTPRIGTISCIAFTGTLIPGSLITCFGNWTSSSGMTLGGGQGISMGGRGNQTITSAGVPFTSGSFTIIAPGGTYSLQDALSKSDLLSTINVQAGTFITNGYNLISGTAELYAGTITTLGASNWTITRAAGSNYVWNVAIGATFNAGTSTITFNDTSSTDKSIALGNSPYHNLSFFSGGTGAINIYGSGTCDNIICSGSKVIKVQAGSTLTLTTASGFQLMGADNNNLIELMSQTAGSSFTLSCSQGVVETRFLSIQDCAALGGSYYHAYNSINISNNFGWLFKPQTGATGGFGAII